MAPKRYYTPQQMACAVEAVNKGLRLAEAAKHFNVPRATLHNKVMGKSPIDCSMGPSTVLSKQEEDDLESWIKDMADKHIPITKEELLDSVQQIIIDKNQETPFSSNRPGKKWFSSFMKRHPTIANCLAQNVTAKENFTREDAEKWFSEVEGYLKNRGLFDILKQPERIFNTDESMLYLNPKPGHVLAKKGVRNMNGSSGNNKDHLTVLVTGNAAGDLAPTFVVYDYANIPSLILKNFPNEWAIGHSESGWMCADTFYEYMANKFNTWLSNKNIEKPILLFLDGQKSYLTWHLSNFCSNNGIEVIALNPNSTHILQPIDLAVFRPLKSSWREEVKIWKVKNSEQDLEKHHFAPLLKTSIEKISADRVKNGFRAGGLYPFGPEYIVTSNNIKCQNRQNIDSLSQRNFMKILEYKIETAFSKNKLKLFYELYYKSSLELEKHLPNEDKSLYLIWANSKQIDIVNEELTSNSTAEALLNPEDFLEINITNHNDSPKETKTISAWRHNTNDTQPDTSLQSSYMANKESTSAMDIEKSNSVLASHNSNISESSKEIQIRPILSLSHHNTKPSPSTFNKVHADQGDLPKINNALSKGSTKTLKIRNPDNANDMIPSPFEYNILSEMDESIKNKKRKSNPVQGNLKRKKKKETNSKYDFKQKGTIPITR